MKISNAVYQKLRILDQCRSDNLIDLLSAAGEDFRTFFNGGCWEGLNFAAYDMSEVEFSDAIVLSCIFREGDISDETISRMALYSGNTLERSDPKDVAAGGVIEKVGSHSEEGEQGGSLDGGFDNVSDVEDEAEGLLARREENRESLEANQSSEDEDSADIDPLVPDEPRLPPPDDLIALVRSYNPHTNEALIREAWDFGQAMHEGQSGKSGESYFTHPGAVARMLAEQQMDDATIITALLKDTVADTEAHFAEVESRFGTEIAELVDGVTKLTNLQLSSKESRQAENFRKLFVATSRDLRVTLVKLADRLHNMRTISSVGTKKQAQEARETMDIYAPLAGRLGMQWMREELEDRAFRILNPEARNSIIRRFITLQRELGDVIQKITADMRAELDKAGLEAEVFGRAKKPYSIWRKMEEKEHGFSRLSDIYGFRIITRSEADCYRVLGVINQRWHAVPGRFKDYISQPKSNGYRSIHTTVSGRDGKRVEVEIRTREMHEVAETGVAAHWSYRDGERVVNRFALEPVRWIAQVTERFDKDHDHEEFLEAVKLEMYQDEVFCFTAKGDVIKLPRGATPLDFAYAIHARIGSTCVGAKVDGLRVPLWTRLKSGQSIEIITAEGQTPQATWIDFVVTGRAKTEIRRSLRGEDRERFIKLGAELARVAFENVGKKAAKKALRTAAKALAIEDADELLARLGSAEITARDVVRAIYPDLAQLGGDEVVESRAVVGLAEDQSFRRAPCCQPVPGERIVGINFQSEGVVVHAIDCPALANFEEQPERWLDLQWHEGPHAAVNTVTLTISLSRQSGAIGRVTAVIENSGGIIGDISIAEKKPDFVRLVVDVDVGDLSQLQSIVLAVTGESYVLAVTRRRKPLLDPLQFPESSEA